MLATELETIAEALAEFAEFIQATEEKPHPADFPPGN
jgi:hypothetical protein